MTNKWFQDRRERKALTEEPFKPGGLLGHISQSDSRARDNRRCAGSVHLRPGPVGSSRREKQQRESVLPGTAGAGPEAWNYSQMHFSPLLTFFFFYHLNSFPVSLAPQQGSPCDFCRDPPPLSGTGFEAQPLHFQSLSPGHQRVSPWGWAL